MAATDKPAPTFDRAFLLELSDGLTFREAERLFENHRVESVEWTAPVLHGIVREGNDLYRAALNLRSTVFAENRCSCADGKRGKICAHALAAALHFEALRQEHSAVDAPPEASPDGTGQGATEEADDTTTEAGPELCSIRTGEAGKALRLLLFLPPNFEAAVERDAIVVKLEAAVEGAIQPLGSLASGTCYALPDGMRRALVLIEQWCGGKLAGLLQLQGTQLRELLDHLQGEPVVYRLKGPNEPIPWRAGRLEGVHSLLPDAPESAPTGAAGRMEAKPVAAAEAQPAVRPGKGGGTRQRPGSKPNRRRELEAGAFDGWQRRASDYPAAATAGDSMRDCPEDRIVVDGSPQFLAVRLPKNDDSVRPLRELMKEAGFLLEPSNRRWWLRDRHKVLNFLASEWTSLRESWQAVFTDNFEKRFRDVSLAGLAISAEASGGGFKLDVRIDEVDDATELRRAIASGRRYVEGSGSRIKLLDAAALDRLHSIERAVSGQADRPFTPSFSKRLSNMELVDAEDVLSELADGWQPPQAWQSRSQALKQVAALAPAPLRAELDGVLRSYQRIGVAWLWHLYRHELGGVLADEMGLGKTVQALALVECVRSTAGLGKPALVVCPASLVENWAREAARFAPALALVRHHGPARAREPLPLEDADLVITSYGTLRQDSELLATLEWSLIIGDEAQHIKNRRSQNARSLCRLHSAGRFLLTGTPVENSLDDLLSLFAFLMPGYLEKAPGTLSREDKAWHERRQTERAAAYILRRTKGEVAPELPEKIERTLFCEFGGAQRRFYDETLQKTRKELFDLEMGGAAEGRLRFAAFKELLRLRQACVDPRILDAAFPAAESAKLEAFDELLDECLDNGSRMLVFSSFVSALKLLGEHLEAAGHPYAYLDGSTRNRLEVCDRFNGNPGIPVFLISLKAGGTGLNLTGADTVLHYDPWWNPAAEAQATDRTHRIGQKRVVTSIKLIAAGTVEEKVLQLQARKAELLEALFEESEAANAKVSLNELKGLLESG